MIGVEDEDSGSELGRFGIREMGLRALKKALPGEHLMTVVVPIVAFLFVMHRATHLLQFPMFSISLKDKYLSINFLNINIK